MHSINNSHLLIVLIVLVVQSPNPLLAQAQPAKGPGGRQTPDPEKLVEQALEKIDAGDLEEASLLFQRATLLKPTLDKLKLVEGLLYVATRRGAEAVNKLLEYNKTEKGMVDWRGFAALGAIYRKSRMHRQAIFPLEKAKKFAPLEENGKPVRAQIEVDLARAYAGQGKKKKALETAKEARDIAPDDGDIQLQVSEIAVLLNNPELVSEASKRAIAIFENTIRDDVFNMDAHNKLERCYETISKLYNFNIQVDPDNGDNYFQLSKILQKSGYIEHRIKLLDARELVLQAVEKDPNNTEWKLQAAQLEQELGGITESKQRVEDILQNDPQNRQALQLKQRLESSATTVDLP